MSLPWFRLFAEFATDPVVQSLSFDDQRHFVIAMCLKCAGVLDREYPDRQSRGVVLRRAFGLDANALEEANRRLVAVGLVDKNWQPKNWEKRQRQSDVSTDRVRKYRDRMKRNETVSETDASISISESVSSVSNSEEEARSGIEAIKANYPQRAGRVDWITAERICRRLVDDGATWHELADAASHYRDFCAADKTPPNKILMPSTFYGAEDQPWRQPWIPAPNKAEQQRNENVGATLRWLERSRDRGR